MAKDPRSMTVEELTEEIRKLDEAASTGALEHTTPSPQSAPFHYQQVLDDMSTTQKLRTYVGQGMNSAYTSALNMVPGVDRDPIWGQDVSNEGMLERREGPDAAIMRQPGAPLASMAGEAAMVTPMLMGGTGALSRVPGVGRALFGGPGRRMISEGVMQGTLMAPPGEKVKGAIIGGGAGALFPASKWAFNKAARGVEPTDWARSAMNRGVDLQVSQMNPSSTMASIQKNWLNDLPIIGKRLRAGEVQAYEQWKRQAMKDVAAPGATIEVKDNLAGMLDDAYKTYRHAYKEVEDFEVFPYILNTNGPNKPLRTALADAVNASGTYEDSARKAVDNFLRSKMGKLRKLGRKPLGKDFLEIRSEIRDEIRRLRRSQATNAGDKADLLDIAEDKITEALESQLPSDVIARLKAVDSQYARYKIMEDAMWRAGTKPLMPSHITAAVRKAADKGKFARGEGLMREYADTADELFTPHDPAKADQLVASTLPVAAAVMHPGATAAALSPLLASTMTRPGRRVMAGMTRPQQALQTLQDKVMGLSQSGLAQKYGEAPAVFARSGIRSGVSPKVSDATSSASNRALNTWDSDVEKLLQLAGSR